MNRFRLYAALFFASRLIDGGMTLIAVKHGAQELNPFMATLLPHPVVLMLFQFLSALILTFLMYPVYKRGLSLKPYFYIVLLSCAPVLWNILVSLRIGT